MSKNIFLTNEGITYQPNSENTEADCENAQVIGISQGNTQEEAFENLLEENQYLRDMNFREIYCYRLSDNYEEGERYFNIK